MDTQLKALPTLPVLARIVSGCVNSAFSRHFYTFYGPSVQAMATQLGARHRWWTPMIHRGRARRTISAGSRFGQWSPDLPPVLCDRSSPSPRPLARHPAGSGDHCPNQRNKSERKENVRQPQLCSMPASPSRSLKKSGPLEAVSPESAGKKESFHVQVDRIAANFPSRAHFVDPHGEAGDIEHGEGVGGLDAWHSQERAGVDDHAAGAPVDHGDV